MEDQVAVERRQVGAQIRQAEERSVVLERVVRGPHHAVSVAASIADQDDGEAVQTDVVANLFEGPGIDERRNAVDPRAETGSRQSRAHGDHVLLGHAGVDEPLPQSVAQRLQGHEAEITGEEHESWTARGVYERLAEDLSHDSSVSRTAWRYWGSVRGR